MATKVVRIAGAVGSDDLGRTVRGALTRDGRIAISRDDDVDYFSEDGALTGLERLRSLMAERAIQPFQLGVFEVRLPPDREAVALETAIGTLDGLAPLAVGDEALQKWAAATGPRRSRPAPEPPGNTPDGPVPISRPNGEQYFPRQLGDSTDIEVLRKLREQNIYVRVSGNPGTGKTAMIEAAFPDCITVNGHGDMKVSDLVGTHVPQPDGTWKHILGPLAVAMKEGRPLFVDEITRIPSDVLSILYSAIDDRRVLRVDERPDMEPLVAAAGFYAVAGYNPRTVHAIELDEALVSRFAVSIEVTTDLTVARMMGVPAKAINIAANLKERSNMTVQEGGEPIWVPEMRELLVYRRLAASGLGEEFAARTLVGACPVEEDLKVVIDVASKVLGSPIFPHSLGGAV